MSFAEWLEDVRWSANVRRARRWRRRLRFSARQRFDEALRPHYVDHSASRIETRGVFDYPDAFYRVTINDLCRAMTATIDDRR